MKKQLNFRGIQKTSLVDYPPYIVATLFVGGCNFRCGFCHNPELVTGSDKMPVVSEEEIFDFFKKRKKVIDGVCITGGEPLLFPSIIKIIKKIKNKGLLVKVDTNGTNPGLLQELIESRLVDYVAMDIKAPPLKYEKVCGAKVDMDKIQKSIDILKQGKVNYEFRTTVVPKLFNGRDAKDIGRWINGARKYAIQQFRAGKTLDKSFAKEKGYAPKDLEKFKKIVAEYVDEVEVRT